MIGIESKTHKHYFANNIVLSLITLLSPRVCLRITYCSHSTLHLPIGVIDVSSGGKIVESRGFHRTLVGSPLI